MLTSPAYAQATGSPAPGFDFLSLLPIVLIFAVFYFLLIRPQQKKMKDHKNLIQQVRRGDRIVTAGGVIGQVAKVLQDNNLLVEIADGVRVRIVRETVASVLAKTGKVDDRADEDDDDGDQDETTTEATDVPRLDRSAKT